MDGGIFAQMAIFTQPRKCGEFTEGAQVVTALHLPPERKRLFVRLALLHTDESSIWMC